MIVALSLAAAPRGPVAGRGADVAVFIRSPKDALPPLCDFLDAASAYAPMLSPHALGADLGRPLGADLLDASSLAAAGVDVAAPMTVSQEKGATVVCLSGRKPAAEALQARFAAAGPLEARAHRGARLEGVAVGGEWRAGVASKGVQLCFASGAGSLAALKSAADAMGGAGLAETRAWAIAARELEGPVVAFAGGRGAHFAVALRSQARRLAARGRWSGTTPLAAPRDGEPLLGWSAAAPLVASAKLAPAAWAEPSGGPFASALEELAAAALPRKDATAARALWEALKGRCAGPLALIVAGIEPAAAGQPAGGAFLYRQAWAAALKDEAQGAAAIRAALAKLSAAGARVEPEPREGEAGPFRLAVGERSIFVGVRAGAAVVANDAGARDLAFAALEGKPRAGAARAGQLTLDGPKAAAALSRISLLDAARSSELGALFAASIEAGALLRAAGTFAARADPEPEGGRFEAELSLP